MKTRALVSLCATLLVAIAASTISFSGTRFSGNDPEQTAVCEHGGLTLTALLNSASAQHQADGAWCGTDTADSSIEPASVQVPVINLHQAANHMYISGEGFSSSDHLDIDIHLLSGGAMGSAYSLAIDSNEAGSFTSQSTGLFCQGPKDRLYVLVIDGHGNEHARIFEPGEFRCPAS